MVYSDTYKYIFYAVPKTGSRSIQEYLEKYGKRSQKGWVPNHNNYEQVKTELGKERCDAYLKFAFFRNPWSWLISLFFFNRHIYNYPPHKKGVIEWLSTYRSDDPFAPYLFDKEGNIVLDFIGKLEHVDRDFKIVCEKMGLPPPQTTYHIGKQDVKGRLYYTAYYDDNPKLIKKVGDMFSRSNKILKYSFTD